MPSVRAWFGCPECHYVTRTDSDQPGDCPQCSGRLARLDVDCPSPRLATRILRLAGYLADQAVMGVILIPALYAAGVMEARERSGIGVFLSAFGWASIAFLVYYIVPTALWGQTLGKLLVGTRVVGPDGRAPGWGRALVRGIVASLADLLGNPLGPGVFDPLWLVWDRHRQTLHDKAAGTIVIVSRARRPVVMLILSIMLAAASQVGLVFAAIRPFIIQAYYVPSGSMHYTLMENDRLLVNKLSYRYGKLRRRDIVVFRPPDYVYGPWAANSKREDFIKRLIALPGDMVEVKDHRLFINGYTAEEPYLADRYIEYTWGPVTVPKGHVLVFGDNRNNSNDSSKWTDNGDPAPFLPIENIRGRAFYRFWPIPRMGDLGGFREWANAMME